MEITILSSQNPSLFFQFFIFENLCTTLILHIRSTGSLVWTCKYRRQLWSSQVKMVEKQEQNRSSPFQILFFSQTTMPEASWSRLIQAAWMAQRFSATFSPVDDPRDPGSSPTSGSLHGACFSLCLCLCLCVCVCLSWINKIFFLKKYFYIFMKNTRLEFFLFLNLYQVLVIRIVLTL